MKLPLTRSNGVILFVACVGQSSIRASINQYLYWKNIDISFDEQKIFSFKVLINHSRVHMMFPCVYWMAFPFKHWTSEGDIMRNNSGIQTIEVKLERNAEKRIWFYVTPSFRMCECLWIKLKPFYRSVYVGFIQNNSFGCVSTNLRQSF